MTDHSSLITHHSSLSSSLPFYIVGGTLQLDAPSYVARRADTELYDGLTQGKFCYALTPRQMGKSSLMIRAGARLREEGVGVAVLDLTAIGQNLDAEQWYGGLLNQIGQQLNLEDELLEFWDRHPKLGPLQRWMRAIREVVLPRSPTRLVIFVDEIDAVRNLPFSTDEFFAGIREFYNRRAEDAELRRLAFCLLGVATPSDLIRDTRTTPFNIGQRIELTDFTEAEAAPLAQGLNCEEKTADALLKRILYWTGGHPYLTQRLCLAVAQTNPQSPVPSPQSPVPNPQLVDRLCEELFLSSRARELDDNLLFVRERILRSEADLAGLLDLYSRVRNHKRVRDDETNPLISILRLSGVTRAKEGYLSVRNRIYERVFDREWITANMPDAELRRQRAAYRRGLLRATAAAAVILIVMGVLSVAAIRGRQQAVEQGRIAEQEKARAVQERSRAEEETWRADRNAQDLEGALAEAKEQRENAEERGAEAERQGLSNRRLLYAAHLNLAQRAWEAGNIMRVVDLLEKQRSGPGQEDLRGFEWRYLWQLCHRELRTLRLPANITTQAFSADGRIFAAGCADKTVKLWDVVSGKERVTLKGHSDEIRTIAFSSDGKRLVTGSSDGTTKFWDVATGKELPGDIGIDQATSIAFSPNGRQLATGSQDGVVKIWDLAARKETISLEGHTDSVTSMAFSSDGKRLATGSEDGAAKLWDVMTGKELYTFGEHANAVTSVAFSPDGGRLVTGSQDYTARLWDIVVGQKLFTLEGHAGAVTSVAFSHNGTQLATGSSDNTVRLWNVAVGQSLLTIKGHLGAVISVAFFRDDKHLVTGSRDNTIKLWDLAAELEPPVREHLRRIDSLAFSPDGKSLATASLDRTAKLWDVATGKRLNSFDHTDFVTSVAFSRDGKQLVTGSGDTVKLLDLATGKALTVEEQFNHVNSVAFSPNGQLLAIGSDEEAVKLWDVPRRRALAPFKGHTNSVTCVVFSPDGKQLATGSLDGTAKLWDVAARKEINSFKKHKDVLTSVQFSPDGKQLATGSQDGTATLWDVATARDLATFEGHTGWVTAVAFSPDGKRLATGSADTSVRLWDIATRQEVYIFKEHTEQVSTVTFSPDGQYLATGSWDRTWRLFRAATTKQ
ncbi:MAG: AAA-like domain-containing protein [Acidobacteria bacterium]|nr:AAA-like domain-containing protein [Acidobacteriota bacterium]